MAKINGILVQSSGSEPHVKYIMHELATKVPRIQRLGGKVDRKTRVGTKSAHADGRAIDIYLNAGNPVHKTLGDELCELFKWRATSLKIAGYIWNHCTWRKKMVVAVGECRPYSGNNDARGPHTDHIHLEFENTDLSGKPISFIRDVIVPIHKHMATRDLDAPVSGWGSWDPDNPKLLEAVAVA